MTVEQKNKIINRMVTQLGGKRFLIMTGSKPQFMDTKNNPLIVFKLVKNVSSANYMKLSYIIGSDLYTMEFNRVTSHGLVKTISKHKGLYGNMLEQVFTKETALYTRL